MILKQLLLSASWLSEYTFYQPEALSYNWINLLVLMEVDQSKVIKLGYSSRVSFDCFHEQVAFGFSVLDCGYQHPMPWNWGMAQIVWLSTHRSGVYFFLWQWLKWLPLYGDKFRFHFFHKQVHLEATGGNGIAKNRTFLFLQSSGDPHC